MTIRGRKDRGSATVFAAAISLILVMVASAAVVVVGVVLATHRARNAADLAALAAATVLAQGGDACSTARGNASANGAEVTNCLVTGDASSFVVRVTVAAATELKSPLPNRVSAEAAAGNVISGTSGE